MKFDPYDENDKVPLMNISGYEFQVIFCALILLGLAAVALIVDYLKGMNEKLRERHIELMAKHEVVVQRVEEDNTRLLRALAEQSKAFREMNKKSILVSTKPAEKALPEITLAPVPEEESTPQEPALFAAGPVAVEDTLPPNVVRIRLKQDETEPAPQPTAAEPDFDRFMEQLVTEFEETPAPAPTVEGLESLAQKLQQLAGNLEVPAGTHPPSVLNQLLERKDVFTGLVLSVGINDYMKLDEIHGRTAAEELLNTVDLLMSQIAGETGFCSRRSDDEFVLIFSHLSGAQSQQRLAEISERLWDYQLQSLGTFAVVFSWGATTANAQPLAEALNTASDNMLETRANRKNSASAQRSDQRATA